MECAPFHQQKRLKDYLEDPLMSPSLQYHRRFEKELHTDDSWKEVKKSGECPENIGIDKTSITLAKARPTERQHGKWNDYFCTVCTIALQDQNNSPRN
jgi:hypothetical protein